MPTWVGKPEVHLTHNDTSELISGWTYDHLKDHWGKKHSGVVYVEAQAVPKDNGRYPSHFVFGTRTVFGTGTSPNVFTAADCCIEGDS